MKEGIERREIHEQSSPEFPANSAIDVQVEHIEVHAWNSSDRSYLGWHAYRHTHKHTHTRRER